MIVNWFSLALVAGFSEGDLGDNVDIDGPDAGPLPRPLGPARFRPKGTCRAPAASASTCRWCLNRCSLRPVSCIISDFQTFKFLDFFGMASAQYLITVNNCVFFILNHVFLSKKGSNGIQLAAGCFSHLTMPIQADMMFSQSTNPGVAATELAEKMTQRNLVTLQHLALGWAPVALGATHFGSEVKRSH